MDDLRAAHEADTQSNGNVQNGHSNGILVKNGASPIISPMDAMDRTWGGDKRLALYGYTIETINMLLLPMIQTKYV